MKTSIKLTRQQWEYAHSSVKKYIGDIPYILQQGSYWIEVEFVD